METILNPFGYGQATKVVDENRKTADVWREYFNLHQVLVENEFYVLFEDGLLVKKTRSKFSTSQYIKGEKFKCFRSNYEPV
jgi:hypothetical protein